MYSGDILFPYHQPLITMAINREKLISAFQEKVSIRLAAIFSLFY